jgi:hypothetical protein
MFDFSFFFCEGKLKNNQEFRLYLDQNSFSIIKKGLRKNLYL